MVKVLFPQGRLNAQLQYVHVKNKGQIQRQPKLWCPWLKFSFIFCLFSFALCDPGILSHQWSLTHLYFLLFLSSNWSILLFLLCWTKFYSFFKIKQCCHGPRKPLHAPSFLVPFLSCSPASWPSVPLHHQCLNMVPANRASELLEGNASILRLEYRTSRE